MFKIWARGALKWLYLRVRGPKYTIGQSVPYYTDGPRAIDGVYLSTGAHPSYYYYLGGRQWSYSEALITFYFSHPSAPHKEKS